MSGDWTSTSRLAWTTGATKQNCGKQEGEGVQDFGNLTIVVCVLSDELLIYGYQQGQMDRWDWHFVKCFCACAGIREWTVRSYKLGRSTRGTWLISKEGGGQWVQRWWLVRESGFIRLKHAQVEYMTAVLSPRYQIPLHSSRGPDWPNTRYNRWPRLARS